MRWEAYKSTDPRFEDELLVSPQADGKNWLVHDEFDYHTDVELASGFNVVEIPAGFVTDFASIPRALWPVLPPTGKYGKAAVVHDYLYRTVGVARRNEADAVLKEAMIALGVGFFTRWTIYSGVRAGGRFSYKGGF